MERTEVLGMMGELKLYGMKAAYDETLSYFFATAGFARQMGFRTAATSSVVISLTARLKNVDRARSPHYRLI